MSARRTMTRAVSGAAIALMVAAAGIAAAKEKPKTVADRAAAFDKVSACRQITDDAKRLACFDGAVAALEAAEKSGDVVVVDRARIHEARRQSFGLPNLDAFNFLSRGDHPENVEKITGVIASASEGGEGKWVIITQDGQIWSETDAETFYPEPRAGDRVEIRKGMLGAYFMKINNNVSLKVKRDK